MFTIVRPAIAFNLPWARPFVQMTGPAKARFLLYGVEQCPACPEPPPCPECPEPEIPALTRQVSNIITDHLDRPCARTIRAYRRHDGVLLSETLSDAATGSWSLMIGPEEATIVALDADDSPLLRDLTLRVGPSNV